MVKGEIKESELIGLVGDAFIAETEVSPDTRIGSLQREDLPYDGIEMVCMDVAAVYGIEVPESDRESLGSKTVSELRAYLIAQQVTS